MGLLSKDKDRIKEGDEPDRGLSLSSKHGTMEAPRHLTTTLKGSCLRLKAVEEREAMSNPDSHPDPALLHTGGHGLKSYRRHSRDIFLAYERVFACLEVLETLSKASLPVPHAIFVRCSVVALVEAIRRRFPQGNGVAMSPGVGTGVRFVFEKDISYVLLGVYASHVLIMLITFRTFIGCPPSTDSLLFANCPSPVSLPSAPIPSPALSTPDCPSHSVC